MDELAQAAGVPVRTVRFYRERKLLPAPRREGRIAWYNEHHLARLRTITALLERGHTLGGIAELMDAWESGRRDVGELLGLDPALNTPWSEEEPLRLTPEGLADFYGEQATAENLATALDIGYIAVDGDDVVHVSRRLLEASSALVKEGIPLAEVLAAGRDMRHRMDLLAELFVELARAHVLPDAETGLQTGDTTRLTEAIARLRPLVKAVVEAELALAMDRRLREELKG
ncbi:MerR family transcriptional regulator [Streptomyces sp. NPDC088354]|uniref:MerR family transcriptional regulator n=1 Tax=unclassified Streptomyces TaxID=2593676 RepID=UPI0029B02D3E|nr:MerR family transcriptional regulator [Streptomyces sp. MI02-7b]MDX3074909.1 MerR family transcriptional regulator [Streptomyces sp. MI02-7b]